MVAILENPEVRQLVRTISVREYEEFGERINGSRTELIRGIIIEKMTASPYHSFLIARLQKMAQKAAGPDAHCRQEQPIKMTDSMPEPDLVIVPGQEEDYLDEHPSTGLLAIEVAVTSVGLDHEKAALYAEAGILEYWIVIANEKAVEVYTGLEAKTYTQRQAYTGSETFVSKALPTLRVDLEALFRR